LIIFAILLGVLYTYYCNRYEAEPGKKEGGAL